MNLNHGTCIVLGHDIGIFWNAQVCDGASCYYLGLIVERVRVKSFILNAMLFIVRKVSCR